MQANIILGLNSRMAGSDFLIHIIPILADIFVFSYPMYLIILYFSGPEVQGRKSIFKLYTNRIYKYNALILFSGFVGVVIVNYIIKFFVTQERPFHSISLSINPQAKLLLDHIPTDAFPSDHAAVGAVIAIITLILGYRQHNKTLITIGRIFVVLALIMDITRIMIGLHRPIDIIGGTGVAFLIAYTITYPSISQKLYTYIYNPLINRQEKIFLRLKGLFYK